MNSYRRTPIRARTTHNKGSTCAFCAWALYTASRQRASSKSRRGELSNNLWSKTLYYIQYYCTSTCRYEVTFCDHIQGQICLS